MKSEERVGEGGVESSMCHARNAMQRPSASLWQQFQVPSAKYRVPYALAFSWLSIIAISVALPAEHPHAHTHIDSRRHTHAHIDSWHKAYTLTFSLGLR